jgi:hypothetical protein
VPESEFILEALPRVMSPAQLLLFAVLRKAPPLEIPVPFRVSVSAPIEVVPLISIEPPLVTETPPAVVPNALALLARAVAFAFTVVAPVYVFASFKITAVPEAPPITTAFALAVLVLVATRPSPIIPGSKVLEPDRP